MDEGEALRPPSSCPWVGRREGRGGEVEPDTASRDGHQVEMSGLGGAQDGHTHDGSEVGLVDILRDPRTGHLLYSILLACYKQESF